MKKTKISMLALSVIAGGVIAASAVTGWGENGYYDTQALDYPLNGVFPGTPTNIITVDAMPVAVGQDIQQNGGSLTDGAGKIFGSEYVTWYRSGPGNRTNNYAVFATDITGNVSTKGSGPQVKMKVKGNGYYLDASGVYNAGSTMNLTVAGSGLSQSIPAETLTYSNATEEVVEVYYTDYRQPGQTFTNYVEPGETRTEENDARFDMPATITGTIKLNKGTTIKWDKTTAGKFSTESQLWTWNATTRTFSLVQNGGGLGGAEPLQISAQVIQPAGKNAKLWFAPNTEGGMGDGGIGMFTGKGSVNDKKGTYTANIKGVGFGKGSQLNMKGSLGPSFVDYAPTTNATPILLSWTNETGVVTSGTITNTFSGVTYWYGYTADTIVMTNDTWATNIVLGAIKTIEAQGKVIGQKVPKTQGLNLGAPSPDPLEIHYEWPIVPEGPNPAF